MGGKISSVLPQLQLAPILLEGILAQALNITKAESQAFVAALTAAVDKRVAEGRSLVYGNWPWKKLLRQLSKAALAEDAGMFSAYQVQARWIRREGGAKATITAAERRLGLTLPEDYKQFLRVSNGLPAFPLLNPELLPVEEIDYYKVLEEEELYHITKTYPNEDGEDATIEPYTERALLISRIPDEQMIWLIPPAGENDGWQTWFFAAWLPGERRYSSLRHFIEHALQSLERQAEAGQC